MTRRFKAIALSIALLPIYSIFLPLESAHAAVGDSDTSMTFNGSSAFQVADANSLDITTSITIEAWVKPTGATTSNTYMVLNKENAYQLRINGKYWEYALADAGGWTGINTGVVALNDEWQHVAFVRQAATNEVRFYFNGSFIFAGIADGVGTGSIANTALPFQIGARSSTVGSGFSQYFKGEIDEVRVFKTARSDSEIQADMNNYGPINTTGLVLYFDFNDYSGTTLVNRSTSAVAGPASLTAYGSPAISLYSIESSTVYAATKVTRFLRTFISANGWKIPTGVRSMRVLTVAGGGGGGIDEGGGGGAGGLIELMDYQVVPGEVATIIVGGGGAGALLDSSDAAGRAGNDGTDSQFNSIVAIGGGGGGSAYNTNGLANRNGRSGGSGGGGAGESGMTAGSAGAGTSGQGFNGGAGLPGGTYRGGGGGGAGEAGNTDGNAMGGDGVSSTINDGVTPVFYAGGGSGGGGNGVSGSVAGGQGGGGDGGGTTASPTDGDPNTGGGGGGAGTVSYRNYAGFAGGSGIVILSYSAFSGEFNSIVGATYRSNIQLVATVSAVGRVTFYAKGKVIPGCNKVSTISSTTITAICNWRPSQRGAVSITARIFPSSSPAQSSSISAGTVFVTNRSGSR